MPVKGSSDVQGMLGDLLQPELVDDIHSVPIDTQAQWFEDVVVPHPTHTLTHPACVRPCSHHHVTNTRPPQSATGQVRVVAWGMRTMLEHFNTSSSQLELNEALSALARSARLVAGARRARVYVMRESETGGTALH